MSTNIDYELLQLARERSAVVMDSRILEMPLPRQHLVEKTDVNPTSRQTKTPSMITSKISAQLKHTRPQRHGLVKSAIGIQSFQPKSEESALRV